MDYRIDFDSIEWEPALKGTARVKRIIRGGKIFRLLELTPDSQHPDWCLEGHLGSVLEGELDIEFSDQTIRFSVGDALLIPSGELDKHRPRAASARTVMFLVEDA